MSNRAVSATVATAAACLAILPAGAAAAPADVPDLGAMAIGTGDLPAGATVTRDRPVRFPGAVAAHDRELELSSWAGTTAEPVWIGDVVALYRSRSRASALFTAVRRLYRTPAGRRLLVLGE